MNSNRLFDASPEKRFNQHMKKNAFLYSLTLFRLHNTRDCTANATEYYKNKEIIWFFKQFDVTLQPKQDNLV